MYYRNIVIVLIFSYLEYWQMFSHIVYYQTTLNA